MRKKKQNNDSPKQPGWKYYNQPGDTGEDEISGNG